MAMKNFRELCNCFKQTACVVSITKGDSENREIRIVDGNDVYVNSFGSGLYLKNEFIPNSIYTDYLEKNLNFEEYCYRSAIKKELLHSYAYPEHFHAWMHMLFIPIESDDDKVAYCLYIMEMKEVFDPELLVNPSDDIYSQVLSTTLQLSNTTDFKVSLKNVTREIRKICKALFCCILLVDDEKKRLDILAEDYELNSHRRGMKNYIDDSFYDIVKTWDPLIESNGNCIIINDEKGMEYIKEKNTAWYKSLAGSKIESLVLLKLKSGNTPLGYMWVTDFKSDDTPKIKEILEITTFLLGSQIGNHFLLDKLTRLSSIDVLTGLYNRNKMNSYMSEMQEEKEPIGIVLLDINGLKKVNDLEGHLAGDNLIKRASKVLKLVFGNSYIFRAGGDEFVIMLKNFNEEKIENKLNDLKEKAEKYNVSFAYGYSICYDSNKIEEVLKKADDNMYHNKRDFYNQLK